MIPSGGGSWYPFRVDLGSISDRFGCRFSDYFGCILGCILGRFLNHLKKENMLLLPLLSLTFILIPKVFRPLMWWWGKGRGGGQRFFFLSPGEICKWKNVWFCTRNSQNQGNFIKKTHHALDWKSHGLKSRGSVFTKHCFSSCKNVLAQMAPRRAFLCYVSCVQKKCFDPDGSTTIFLRTLSVH